MEKMYVMLKPHDFWRYASVDIEGGYPHHTIEDFDVDDKFNYIIFELNYKVDSNNNKVFANNAKVLLCEDKSIKFNVNYNESTNGIELGCDVLGMYTNNSHDLDSVTIKPSKASGMLRALQEDSDVLVKYIDSLDRTFELCEFFKEEYDRTVNGPSNSVIKEVIKQYKKS
jgi:hypothetical protein